MEVDEKAIWIARRLLGFIALRELLHHWLHIGYVYNGVDIACLAVSGR